LTIPPPLLHSVRQAAQRLGVSESSIWRLLQMGELYPTSVLGRTLISEAELLRLVADATTARSRSPQLPIERDENADDTPLQTGNKRPTPELE